MGKTKQKQKPASKKSKAAVKSKSATADTLALPSFEKNFGEWFNAVIFQAEILDYRYNLKGCGVWLGYGFKLRRYYLNIMREILESTPIPHEEYQFPLLIPEDQLAKEEKTVKGFEDEVYWVTHGGLTPLDVKLALRPTSETVMYPMAAKWIRAHTDLPLKTYQIVNTFRFEGKNTRPIIRVREITTFKEAHTYHESAADAEAQIREAVGVYKGIFDRLGVPYVVSSRPKWDTFPGALYTLAFDCIFPGEKHRALQIGTVHNLGQRFSKTYNITFETRDGSQEHVYQTCYGISERGVGAVIASHGDDNGLKLPPEIAPIQIVIVPIFFKGTEDAVREACEQLTEKLRQAGYRVKYDGREISTGRKYFHWELRGVPVRIEIGPKDLAKDSVALVRRDIADRKKRKQFIPNGQLLGRLQEIMPAIYTDLHNAAKARHKGWILRTVDLEEAIAFVEDNKGIVEIPFCGKEGCAGDIEKRVDGLKILGIPEEYLPALNKNPTVETDIYCAQCMEKVSKYWRIGRSY